MSIDDPLTERIIGACIEVHRHLGPGLLESVYEECLAHELARRAIPFVRQPVLDLTYKDLRLDRAYQPDLIVHDRVVVEVKSVRRIVPVHCAQLRTYLRLSGIRVGVLVNFHVPALIDGGIRRVTR